MDLPQTRRLTGTRDAGPHAAVAELLEDRLMPVIQAMIHAAHSGDGRALEQLAGDLEVATEAIHAQLPSHRGSG